MGDDPSPDAGPEQWSGLRWACPACRGTLRLELHHTPTPEADGPARAQATDPRGPPGREDSPRAGHAPAPGLVAARAGGPEVRDERATSIGHVPTRPLGAACERCARGYPRRDGIWRFLPDDRAEAHAPFLRRYRAARGHEGWARHDVGYVRGLPYVSPSDPHAAIWRQRARSYELLRERVLRPMGRARGTSLRVLDLGSGNCWLSARLAAAGERAVALDISDDELDGLGARDRYADDPSRGACPFVSVQAEFDRVPFGEGQFDVVVFNASLHYARAYDATLAEARRVLAPHGLLVVMDTPVYHTAASGERMVREREDRFRRLFGSGTAGEGRAAVRPASVPPNAHPREVHEGYLTYHRLRALERTLGLQSTVIEMVPRLRAACRRLRARRRIGREAAAFPLIVLRPRRAEGEGDDRSPRARALWRLLLRWRFRLFQRHRYGRLVLERAAGIPLVVLPQVFNPALLRTGELLARTLSAALVPEGATVLDMGTGSGIGAIAAARWASRVVAVDVSPEAVRCATINALLNRVERKVDVRRGDLYSPVTGERFDLVLFNPPFYRGTPRDLVDRAWRSPDLIERFAPGLKDHLTPRGFALVVLSSDGERDAFLRAFEAADLGVEMVASRDFVNETLTVYRLRPPRVPGGQAG